MGRGVYMKIKMRKLISLLTVVAVMLPLVTACGSNDDKLCISVCGGSIGGAWASIGEGVCEVVRRSCPGANTAYEVGQEAANLALVSAGKIDVGIGHTGLIKLGMEGKEPFDGRDLSNLRALAVLYGEAAQQFIVQKKDGLKSVQDIKDKQYPLRLYFNTKDSFMEIVGKKTLEAHGISYEDIESWGGKVDFMSMGASMDLMRDGKLDAYCNIVQVPSSHIVDAANSLDLDLLSMTDEAIEKVNEELGTYKVTISKDDYKFLENDVETVAATVVLFTSEDMPEEDAYEIVRSMHENIDYFATIHSSLADISLETMANTAPIPLHPGAEKYYRENGVLQ